MAFLHTADAAMGNARMGVTWWVATPHIWHMGEEKLDPHGSRLLLHDMGGGCIQCECCSPACASKLWIQVVGIWH
jgi:hypothetical protein